MGTDQIMYCIVALILGMLLANMLKNVCGCKTVEGWKTNGVTQTKDYNADSACTKNDDCGFEYSDGLPDFTHNINNQRTCGGANLNGVQYCGPPGRPDDSSQKRSALQYLKDTL